MFGRKMALWAGCIVANLAIIAAPIAALGQPPADDAFPAPANPGRAVSPWPQGALGTDTNEHSTTLSLPW